MEITINQAQFFDLQGIGNIMPYLSFMELDLQSKGLQRRSDYFVAKLKEDIVGFIQLTHHLDDESELVRLYVLPFYHRRGIGSLLVKKGFSILKKGTRVTVKVEKRNFGAIAFYEYFQFKKIREIYNSLGENLLEYWRYI